MRMCREIPKHAPLECSHIDDSWCKLNKKWCCSIEKCKVKTPNFEEPKGKKNTAFTPEEVERIKQFVDKHPHRSTENQKVALAVEMNRTFASVHYKIHEIRKEIKGHGQTRTYQRKQKPDAEIRA